MSRIKSKSATFRLRQPNAVATRMRASTLLSVLFLSLFVPQAIASNGGNGRVPATRTGKLAYSKQSGLQIYVDSTWAGNRGYRPIEITATMAKPATADKKITIEIHAGGWGSNRFSTRVEADLELLQGTATTSTKVLVPQYTDWNFFGWQVWVDGVKDEQLCVGDAGYNSGTSNAVAAGTFAPSPRSFYQTQFLDTAIGSFESHPLNLSNLPEQWVDYTPLDVMTTSAQSLELLRVSSPEKLAEILRWVRSGGTLWISEVGQGFSKLVELESIFVRQPTLPSTEATSAAILPLGWHFLKLNGNARIRFNDLVQLSMQETEDQSAILPKELDDRTDPEFAADSRNWFVARSYGLGTVVAFRRSRIRHPQKQELASALQRCSLVENLDWATRHGNDPAAGNPNFNNLLIPDVGAAPVFEFQMLISLFVIGIGPVNYWLLKRRNQLPLLLVTVPVAALAATLMLFTYGFLADGIGVRVRVRSMTILDQRAGEAASWARLSYYAGIAPSDGLQMPVDTVVYPILPARSHRNSFGRRRQVHQPRALEWTEQEQQLTRGWLGSRTPTQYLAITARPTKKQLQFQTQPDQLTVTNQLGTQVLALVVQNHDGAIFVLDAVDVGGSAKLTPSTYVQAASKLRMILTENLPQLPVGYVQQKRSFSNDYGVPMSDSLMELHFEAIVSPAATGWGNGTYVAVTSTGIEVPLGLEGATESSSFHVVRGTW